MADAVHIPDEAEVRARWGAFAWTEENARKAQEVLARYPAGREQSGSIPLLDLAQRQVGAETQTQGWLPVPVIEYVARYIGVPYMRVYEVATFYTMFNREPIGEYFVQVCTTTPCMLGGCGSTLILDTIKDHLGIKQGQTSKDGKFTLIEAECLGACSNAPMVQINDEYYEDLTPETIKKVLDDMSAGRKPKPGPQSGRRTVEPKGQAITLVGKAAGTEVFAPEWR